MCLKYPTMLSVGWNKSHLAPVRAKISQLARSISVLLFLTLCCSAPLFAAQSSPPTVSTTTVTGITTTSAASGGNVSKSGTTAVAARGVCWSTTANPTTANSVTLNGTGTGTFTSSVTGLSPFTTYHIRAYATNSIGTAYGTDLTFTTLGIALTITTQTVSQSKLVGGTATFSVVASGTPNPTYQWKKGATNVSGATSSSYTTPTLVIGDNGAVYTVVVTNAAGSVTSASATLTVTVGPPAVTSTTAISTITTVSASSGGTITADGGAAVTARGVCWFTSPNPTTANSNTNNGTGIGTFSSALTGLNPATLYYVRAYATRSAMRNQILHPYR